MCTKRTCGKKKAKEKTYVCVVCGKKANKKTRCCGKEMVSHDKGSWNI